MAERTDLWVRLLPKGRLPWLGWLVGLGGCGWAVHVNAPSIPCPEISAAQFEAALRGGAVRGDVRVRSQGALQSLQTVIGANALETCRPASARGASQPCRLSNDLVVRYDTDDRGLSFVKVPAGRWHRFLQRNPAGACRLLP
ncbi:MAG: hypothetical protein FJ082_15275 [Cyanobacteria bacterium K_Offshore_surface_m2_011]|nr:hypothetical protein [Cyanobacteria bacterium K_Offshore_surface_m2_011]